MNSRGHSGCRSGRWWCFWFPFLLGSLAMPACASPRGRDGRFFREHVNDLDAMLKAVSYGPYVVFTMLSLDYRLLAANWHYAITHFGRVPNVLVITFEEHTLVECMIMGFPCFNASTLIRHPSIAAEFTYGQHQYNRMMWGKVIMIYEVLMRGYTTLASDADTVWFKDALRSHTWAADFVDADVVGMNENDNGHPNAGNLFVKNNPRTRAMAQAWVSMAFDLKTREFNGNASRGHDQDGLRELNGTGWLMCRNSTECLSVKAQGKVAVWMHGWHGCVYIADHQPCAWSHLPYLHIFCTSDTKDKIHRSIQKGLWFVGSDSNELHMVGAKATDLINATGHYRHSEEAATKGVALPCKDELPSWNLS